MTEPKTRWQCRGHVISQGVAALAFPLKSAWPSYRSLSSAHGPSVAGRFRAEFEESCEDFDKFVRNHQMRSVSERRDYVMVLRRRDHLEPLIRRKRLLDEMDDSCPENAISPRRPSHYKNPPWSAVLEGGTASRPVVSTHEGGMGNELHPYRAGQTLNES